MSSKHVHLLLSAPRILAPVKLVQYIKGRSSPHVQAEFPELRKRYGGHHMWARDYFCATVGAVLADSNVLLGRQKADICIARQNLVEF